MLLLNRLLAVFFVSCTMQIMTSESISSLESLLRRHDRLHKDEVILWSGNGQHRKLLVATLDRNFSLHLLPHDGIFANHFEALVEDRDGNRHIHTDFDPSEFYIGYVEGETESSVTVHLDDEGIVTATISLPHDAYFIEPSWRHVTTPHDYHMIAYRQSDIILQLGKRFNNGSYSGRFCGNKEHDHGDDGFDYYDSGMYKYSVGGHMDIQERLRRAVPQKNTCKMILVADHQFLTYFGGGSVRGTMNYMVGSIIRIDRETFRPTVFGNGYEGMRLQVRQIIVHEDPTTKTQHYNYDTEWDVSKKLEAFSMNKDWQHACLAHLFTYHDFEDGVLGLAYVASPRQSTVGGICSRLFRGTRSLRVGLTTPFNYGRKLLRGEVDIVLAHGHNWGSPHDPTSSNADGCNGNDNGRFLMYPSAQNGREDNNQKFSTCSQTSIGNVLAAKSSDCFTENNPLCGNYVVEDGEDCDSGFNGSQCCSSQCKFINESVCSDDNSMCCLNCHFAQNTTVCHQASENNVDCVGNSVCNATSPACPDPLDLPDNTSCGIAGGVCKGGQCSELCGRYELQSCECPNENERCLVCCKINGSCRTLLINVSEMPDNLKDTLLIPPDNKVKLPDGSQCNNFTGTCSSGNCENIVQDLLSRLWDSLREISLDSVAEWFRNNIVADVLIFSLLVWVPASLTIYYFDMKRIKKLEETEDEYLEATDPDQRTKLQSTSDNWASKPPRRPSKRGADEQPLINYSAHI